MRGSVAVYAVLALLASTRALAAEGTGVAPEPPSPGATAATVVDRTVVRYVTPETGGAAYPRFVSLRLLHFLARVEAALDRAVDAQDPRFARIALERLVAEDMLASLWGRRIAEPVARNTAAPALSSRTLAEIVADAREDLCDRLGGCAALEALMAKEGIVEAELGALLLSRGRAALYVDRVLFPILRPSEEEVREAFRSAQHPYKDRKFEAARDRFTRWLRLEKLRLAEDEFFQAARSRAKIVVMAP